MRPVDPDAQLVRLRLRLRRQEARARRLRAERDEARALAVRSLETCDRLAAALRDRPSLGRR